MGRFICVFLLVSGLLSGTTDAQNSPYFNKFRGMEDTLGNTHLFYKEHIGGTIQYTNHVYHLDLTNQTDSILIRESSHWIYPNDQMYNVVTDFKFWDNNPATYIYCGFGVWIDATAYIARYDTANVYTNLGELDHIEISFQNDSLVYAAGQTSGPFLLRSDDAGISWFPVQSPMLLDMYLMISMSPFDDQTLFSLLWGGEYYLFRSLDGGMNYSLVDSLNSWSKDTEMWFDPDSTHIYALSPFYYGSYFLKSADAGDNWQLVTDDTVKMSLCIDQSVSGVVYLSKDRDIYRSNDHATTFALYRTVDRPVIGMYKKPGTDLLYAATEKDIYEISAGSITSIKSLPVTIEPGSQLMPEDFVLYQNYPNPFNSGTTIEFYLPQTAEIKIEIYNLLGQKVWTLWQGRHPAGQYQLRWDGRDEMGREVASGVYIYQLVVGKYRESRKMLLLR